MHGKNLKSSQLNATNSRLWVILLVTISVQVLATFTSLSLAAIAPDVAVGLRISPELVGFQVSLLYLGAALMSTIAGFQLRRWGPIRVSQASLAFCVFGASLVVVPSVYSIAVGSLIIGFGYGMTNPAASELLLRLVPVGRRNLIFSIKQTGVPIGGALAGLTGPSISQYLGWQSVPVVAAVSCLLLVFIMQPLRKKWDSNRDPSVRFSMNIFDSITIVLSSLPLIWLSASGFFYAAVQLCLATFVVTLLVTDVSFSLVGAGIVLAVIQGSGALGRIFWGWVADRLGHGILVLLIMGAVCISSSFLVSAITENWQPLLIYILFFFLGFNALGWTGVFQVEAARYAPEGKLGAVIGGITAPSYGGVIFGPAAFSILFIYVGSYTTTFLLVALFALLGMLCLALVSRAGVKYNNISTNM